MRVFVFHGYLLRGTGSNVYNAELAQALAGLGHEVHLLAQDEAPDELPWVDAVGDWVDGVLDVRALREPVRITVYRPPIGRLLPVYVADRYEGFEAKPFAELTGEELDDYLDRNVTAARDVAERVRPDVALANHLVMGPVIVARALGSPGIPYAVKVHGSALEYTVKPHPRFLPFAREGLGGAAGVLVGSRHTGESLWAAMAVPGLREKTRLGPPGVDLATFRPRDPAAARAGLATLAAELAAAPAERATGSSFDRDVAGAARAVAGLTAGGDGPLVLFVGKLIVSKGIDLLVAAWPLVLARVPDARLVVVGFGAYEAALLRLTAALAEGDEDTLAELVAEGRAAEGGPRSELTHLRAFLAQRDDAYRAAARALPDRIAWVGRLEHSELAQLLPACDAQVVPSTFPEAFGMVAAEAAACGVLPVSARHSGLAEVSAALAGGLPAAARPWLSYPVDDDAVCALASRIVAWLEAPAALRAEVRGALAAEAAGRYGWDQVARGVISAARGELAGLPPVQPDTITGT